MARAELALLTGAGVGAVAVVLVTGEDAARVVDSIFRPTRGPGLLATHPGRPRIGRVGAGIGDEVVALIVPGPGLAVEIQGHGGTAATALVVAALLEAGATRVDTSASIRRSAGSRLRAEALLDLPHATTLRTAGHLLDQADGTLDRELARIGATRDLAAIDALIARAPIGLRLLAGWRVVLAGRPNVGKSRLLNALVGFDRAIVDPTPGTTRDVVTAATALDGWPVELADTAGLRDPADPIEAIGVERARSTQRDADLVVVVLDRSEPISDDDRRILARHPGGLVVANKADLPAAWDGPGLVVSAERGDGIERLAAEIGGRLVPNPPPAGSAIPFRARQVRRLGLLRERLRNGDLARFDRGIARWLGTPGL